MKRIVLTGGGTAGHVTPNMALVPKLIDEGYNIYYIGSYEGMEKKLIEDIGIKYFGISSGKLRRYFDIKNFSDPFRVIKGFFEAKKILKKLRPDVVFSKGGFVTVKNYLQENVRKDFVFVDLTKINQYFLLSVEVLDLLRSIMRSVTILMHYLRNIRSFIFADVTTLMKALKAEKVTNSLNM